jgi:hypothetical protein
MYPGLVPSDLPRDRDKHAAYMKLARCPYDSGHDQRRTTERRNRLSDFGVKSINFQFITLYKSLSTIFIALMTISGVTWKGIFPIVPSDKSEIRAISRISSSDRVLSIPS